MRALAAYLAAAGYRTLHCLTGPAGVYALDIRADALIQAAADAGLPRGSVTVQHLAAVDYDCACAAVAPRLGDLPDCFVCANDFMALGVVNTLTAHGIAVPQRAAVAGFDNSVFPAYRPSRSPPYIRTSPSWCAARCAACCTRFVRTAPSRRTVSASLSS